MTIEERRAKGAEKQRAWRARNPERANAIAAACRRRNRAKIAASWKIYYEKNKATLYEKKKSYLARNSEKLRQWKRADYERHRESYIARSHRRWREKNDECRAYEAKRYQRDKAIIVETFLLQDSQGLRSSASIGSALCKTSDRLQKRLGSDSPQN
jgi:hypothetical protein